jgi:Kef-type K+ transport system membrane component KefB
MLRKINMPDIIGLILAGVIIGPYGYNILSREIGLSIFGTIGLLYLMFLAGLEIDLNDFFRRRRQGTLFGFLTFLIPFVPGFIVFYYLLDYQIQTALLVATMLASHTLVAYPILSRFGIINNKIVTITIAGTIIADTVVLIILGVISDSVQGDLSLIFWLRTLLFFILFFVFVLKLLPMVAKWFFSTQNSESGLQYVFVLTAIFISATVAEILQIEPLIGAFFAGLSLNRYIPRESLLMNRVLFIGNTLFIPFFLISIGMMVNTEVLINDSDSWVLIGVLAVLAIGGKFVAAWVMQIIYKFNNASRNLIFGLSAARAASAIAIMIVGYTFKIVDDQLLNSTIFIILLTSVVSSMVTQRSGHKIAGVNEEGKLNNAGQNTRLLVALGNPKNVERLMEFSLLINSTSSEPIFPLSIISDDRSFQTQNQESLIQLDLILKRVSRENHNIKLTTRVNVNVVDGISKAIKELDIARVVLGWNSQTTTIERLFGSVLDKLLINTNKMVLVSKLENEMDELGNIQAILPENIYNEKGFQDLIVMMLGFAAKMERRIFIYGNISTLKAIEKLDLNKGRIAPVMIEIILNEDFFQKLSSGPLADNDLLFFVKARKKTVAHNKLIENYPKLIQQYFYTYNLVMVYPEQTIIPKGIYQLYNINN